jgi:GNAT superfamily N-acetyltransferase
MSVIGVRLASAADIDVLVDLMREFYAEADFPLDAAWAADAFSTLIADPALGAVWIISADDAPIGHVVLTIRYAMEFGGLIGYIDDLFVRKAHRRLGAATAGLEALVAECNRRGCKSIHVEVGPGNVAAVALYRRFGLAPGADERLQLKTVLPGEQ